MKNNKPLIEWLKWSRVGFGLLPSGFCPDSQNGCSDGAKIGKVSETSKLLTNFFIPKA